MNDPQLRSFEAERHTPIVYGLMDPRDGLIRFVAHAMDVGPRFRQHVISREIRGNLPLARWREDLRKAGEEPRLEVLCECETIFDAEEKRKAEILRLIGEKPSHPILNMKDGVRGARMRDWIDLGYEFKSAHHSLVHMAGILDAMLPRSAPERRHIDKAIKELKAARNSLGARLRTEYPKWKDEMDLFYGPPEEHFQKNADAESQEEPRE